MTETQEQAGRSETTTQQPAPGGFKGYAMKRITVGVLMTFAALWIFGTVLGFFDEPATVGHRAESTEPVAADHSSPEPAAVGAGKTGQQDMAPAAHTTAQSAEGHASDAVETATASPHAPAGDHAAAAADHATPTGKERLPSATTAADESRTSDLHGKTTPPDTHRETTPPDAHTTGAAEAGHSTAATGLHGTAAESPYESGPKGVAFISATIEPLAYELTERFWGWRPNDILDFTDNVNNFQLGVLEVTRRTAVTLAERISRTGSTAAFDKNLENAMNWFMIKAEAYWFPSPESKYKDGLNELKKYKERLIAGSAKFYTRTDNLIPLLMQFEDLLGSCDDNLVKATEDDGSPVSHFAADDYFFYAKGVASAMYTLLQAIYQDFHTVIESRRGTEVLHHAIASCHHAMELDPVYITNSDLSGVLANHRANMAAPISHARFYLGVLIKTLST